MMYESAQFHELLGKVLTDVKVVKSIYDLPHIGSSDLNDHIIFTTTDGDLYKLYHENDCCEHVYIEDIEGEISDLLDSPLIQAECSSSNEYEGTKVPDEYNDSYTWTFYKLGTSKGSVTIRWLGTSNGFYSEEVDFAKISS